ncbi:class II glutamine amidotransferase [Phaeobacter sp. HF9A]|uniref:class II glutamine amidotransferase n=1 Tax=Phaeobacter sp. HF9A TaxID=2721561 RepID=UPI0014303B89|nr:class II glutamine amidotransferase [Phaeobacter sp. HF9A]NIZ12828.1 class II glutamine amidotransferase [Phaeobacter sp. HF9A]
MCRFLAWVGAPRFIDELVLDQKQSLVAQSRNALIGKTPINADGFGLAWYAHRETPCLYKDTHPAWSDPNLKQLAGHIKSGLFLAHVRASTGMATSRNNSHPFAVGNWCFMHNGQAGGHERFRQALDALIPSDLYGSRFGATDSEAIFLIALGHGLQTDPIGAMARAVNDVQSMAERYGTTPFMRFAACWSDGTRLFAARMASDGFAPSLYVRPCAEGHIVSSEPLDDGRDTWIEVKPGTAIEVTPEAVIQHEFTSDITPLTETAQLAS